MFDKIFHVQVKFLKIDLTIFEDDIYPSDILIFHRTAFLARIILHTFLHTASSSANIENRGREKFWRNQSTTGPVAFISASWYHSRHEKRYEEGLTARLLGIATDAPGIPSGMKSEEHITRVQLGASQRSWHDASFRFETRFEEGREKRPRRLNRKYFKRYASLAKISRSRMWNPSSFINTWFSPKQFSLEPKPEGWNRNRTNCWEKKKWNERAQLIAWGKKKGI